MSNWKDFEDRIIWDFKPGEEFKRYTEGYAFIVDVIDEVPWLSLYKIKKYSCQSSPIKQQPPREMLLSALDRQGADIKRGGLFEIDQDLREWIKENLLKGQD